MLGNVNLRADQFGFGGIFLNQDQMNAHPGIRLEPGSKVEIQFQLPESEGNAHRAVCEVIWKRDGAEAPGYGLKFVDLSTGSRRQVLDMVRTNNILSFIPKGA